MSVHAAAVLSTQHTTFCSVLARTWLLRGVSMKVTHCCVPRPSISVLQQILSDSMQPTLAAGDHILVDKVSVLLEIGLAIIRLLFSEGSSNGNSAYMLALLRWAYRSAALSTIGTWEPAIRNGYKKHDCSRHISKPVRLGQTKRAASVWCHTFLERAPS